MGLILEYKDGQTPLDEEEKLGLLIKTISTHGELDEFEQMNIEKSIEWTITKRFKAETIFTEDFVRQLHRKMFGEVWSWAGNFRTSEKNLGIKYSLISTSLKQLNDDCLFWIKNQTYSNEEIALHYKHKIVSIHCFSNGNGRHSRLMADIIINHIFKRPVFTWSRSNLIKKGEERSAYLNALRQADKGNISSLIFFAKS